MKKINLMMLAVIAIANTAQAHDDQDDRSAVRGTWSFSQFVPSTTLLNELPGDPPIPLVAVGNLVMDADNQFTGHGVFNTPVPESESIELDMNGSCTERGGNIHNGLDCVFNFPAFDLTTTRYCVVMANQRLRRCFDEFRCVNVFEAGQTVALIEFKRQHLGKCN